MNSFNLKLVHAYVVDGRLGAVLSVKRPHAMTEPDLALQIGQQHALAILYDCLAVLSFLQVSANLRHDVGVKRIQQHLVAPSLVATFKILKHERQTFPFITVLTCAAFCWQHSLNSSFKFHNT